MKSFSLTIGLWQLFFLIQFNGVLTQAAPGTLFTYDANGNILEQRDSASVPSLRIGQTLTQQIGTTGQETWYRIVVPANAATLTIHSNSGSGDADLYLKRGGLPTKQVSDRSSEAEGNFDYVSLSGSGVRTYYLLVRGFSDYAGLRIETSSLGPFRPDVAVGRKPRGLTGLRSYRSFARQRIEMKSGLRQVKAVAMIYNHGAVVDRMRIYASRGSFAFRPLYRGPGGNISAALATGSYMTSQKSKSRGPVKITALIKPNKKAVTKRKRRSSRKLLLRRTFNAIVIARSESQGSLYDGGLIRVRTR